MPLNALIIIIIIIIIKITMHIGNPAHCKVQTDQKASRARDSGSQFLRSNVLSCCFVALYQQHACVSWICSDNFMCCHTEIEVADQTFYLTRPQYTDTRPTNPSTDPITPGTWQGSHWSASFLESLVWLDPGKIPSQAGFEPQIYSSRGGRLNH